MGSNIFGIGQSALSAAQVGLSVTGHNIANASTPGYSRQVVIQGAAKAQNFGYGYLGQGTEISSVQRMFSELSNRQVLASQSSSSEISAYSAQMQRIDNLLADPSAGLAIVISDFFSSLQALSSSPSDAAARQAMLSAGNSLGQRFQSLDNQLRQINQDVNSEISTSVSVINAYAKQIGKLNDAIEKAQSADGNIPNDLMDQRDQIINDLNKEIKTTVVPESGGKYNVFIGNGLPLVIGTQTYALSTTPSPTNGTRLEIAYQTKNGPALLGASSLPGGRLGGLLQFRTESLDTIQTQLGHIAMTVANTFNNQHRAGLDSTGAAGSAFFTETNAEITASSNNTGVASISSTISDISKTVASDYRLQYNGIDYIVTRSSDNLARTYSSLPQEIDGLTIKINSGSFAAGDEYLIRPGLNSAANFDVALTNINKIAVGAPTVATRAAVANTGTGAINLKGISANYNAVIFSSPIALTYNSGTTSLSGFPATEAVTVSTSSSSTTYPAGSAVPYTAGATVSFAGLSFQLKGSLNNGDQFTLSTTSTNAPGDNRNGLLLAGLRSANTMLDGTASYEGAFAQLVSYIGSKTNELAIIGAAENKILEQAIATQQSVSGVNLDEEATNLLRYQQAYQAASKMMQIANEMFDALLQLG